MADTRLVQDRCEATLRHAHGTGRCWLDNLPTGHKHETLCESCEEDGDIDTWLHWEGEGLTLWPI